MTLVTTIILSLVAITVSMVLVQQALASANDAQDWADARVAERVAGETVAAFTAQLAADPTFYAHRIFHAERPRVCPTTGQVVTPNPDPEAVTVWPQECGTGWTYLPTGQTTDGYDPATALVRAQVAPPTAGDPTLRLTVLATVGRTEHAVVATYTRPDSSGLAVYSGQPLDLDTLAGDDGQLNLAGTVYSLTGGTVPDQAVPDGALDQVRLVSECGFTNPEGDNPAQWENLDELARAAAGCPTEPGPDSVDVREVTTAPLEPSTALRTLERTTAHVCLETPTTTQDGGVNSLCLRAGDTVVDVDGATVQIPDDVAAYHLSFTDDPTPGVVVRTAQVPPQEGASIAAAATSYAAGTHPVSASGVTWSDLGVLRLPATGVLVTDATTYVGQCAAAVGGTGCDPTAPAAPVTVIAGTPTSPADLVVAGPLTQPAVPDGEDEPQGEEVVTFPVGLVATGQVRVPFWAHTAGGDLHLDGHLYAAGVGTPGPSLLTTPDPGNPGGNLVITGSVGAAHLGLLDGWAQVTVTGTPGQHLAGLPAFTWHWHPSGTQPLSPTQLCGARTCASTW